MNRLVRLSAMLDLLEFTSISATKAVLREIRKKGIPLHRPPMLQGEIDFLGPKRIVEPQYVPPQGMPSLPSSMFNFGPNKTVGEPGITIPRLMSDQPLPPEHQAHIRRAGAATYQPRTMLQHEYGHSQTIPNYPARFERLMSRVQTNPSGVKVNPRKTEGVVNTQIRRMNQTYARSRMRSEKMADDYAQGMLAKHGTASDLPEYRKMAAGNRRAYRKIFAPIMKDV